MLSINPVQNYNNKPNKVSFTSVYVLHLPERFAKLPTTEIPKILKTKGHDSRLLSDVLKQFKLLVKSSGSQESKINYGSTIRLKDGKTGYVRINDHPNFYDVCLGDCPDEILLSKTQDKDTRHYFVNQFDKIQLMG